MSFVLPQFNLDCDVYRGPWATRSLALLGQACNLAFSRRVAKQDTFQDENNYSVLMYLLVPPFTDIRDLSCAAVSDVVEVPSGSGRWYQVASVDDIGKGFSNEHRCALIFKISFAMYPTSPFTGLMWPAPIP